MLLPFAGIGNSIAQPPGPTEGRVVVRHASKRQLRDTGVPASVDVHASEGDHGGD